MSSISKMSGHASKELPRAEILQKIVPPVAAIVLLHECLNVFPGGTGPTAELDRRPACTRTGRIRSLRKSRTCQPHDRTAGCDVIHDHSINMTSCLADVAAIGSTAARPGVSCVVFPAFCPFQLRIHPQMKLGKDGL